MKETPASEPRLGLGEVEGRGDGNFDKQSPCCIAFLFARSRGALLSLFAITMRGALSVWPPLLGTWVAKAAKVCCVITHLQRQGTRWFRRAQEPMSFIIGRVFLP